MDGTTEQHHVKVENFERPLLVKLTDKEKSELADRSAFLLGEIEQKSDEQKSAAKHAKAAIDEKKAELKSVSTQYRDGQKFEKVKCERRFQFRLGHVQEVRTDTGDVLHERPMTERERQLEHPALAGNGKAAAKGEDDDGIVDNDYKPDGATEPPLATQKKKRTRKPKA
jgi:hypothetical protein